MLLFVLPLSGVGAGAGDLRQGRQAECLYPSGRARLVVGRYKF